MASHAKMMAARRNARRSSGPRSEEGKRRSRENALKHGLTARTVLLPDENIEAFHEHMSGWFDSQQPRDQTESSLVERMAFAMWRIGRLERTEAGSMHANADAQEDQLEVKEELEVIELSRELFLPPGGGLTALPLNPSGDEIVTTDKSTKEAAGALRPPAVVLAQLRASDLGCRWLMECWEELRKSLERDGWKAPERFRFFRLIGIHPQDEYMTEDLAAVIQACKVLEPGAGSIVAELWNDGVASTELPLLEAQYERAAAFLPAIDRDQARNCLLARIGAEAMFIADRLGLHTERAMTRASLDHRLLAFDTSPESKLLRRYTSACTNDFFRYQAALNAHRAGLAAETKGEAGAHRDAPSWPWIEAIPTDVRAGRAIRPALEAHDRELANRGLDEEVITVSDCAVSRRLCERPPRNSLKRLPGPNCGGGIGGCLGRRGAEGLDAG